MMSGNRLAEWLSRLVQIPSVAPDQAGPRAGVPGEVCVSRGVDEHRHHLSGPYGLRKEKRAVAA